jgi:hypothetical protein
VIRRARAALALASSAFAFSGHVREPSAPLFAQAAAASSGTLAAACDDPRLREECCRAGLPDEDADGLADACEQALAERFAPIVYHSSDESNFPGSVDRFLAETNLALHDERCPEDLALVRAPTQADLANPVPRQGCPAASPLLASGSRSAGKHETFFLADVAEADRAGSADPSDWTTYLHAYPNDSGGVTLQYWRFYAYNDALNDHGGDWEGLHVVLDPSLRIGRVLLLTHDALVAPPLSRFELEGTHVRVYSEGGGHATRYSGGGIAARGCAKAGRCTIDPDRPVTFIRQETWTGGAVTGPLGTLGETGPLLNLGSKQAPLNGQLFVRYSGLWGSPGVLFGTSGFWGPAYNETSMRADGFVTAWCDGMPRALAREECYPPSATP